MARTAAVLPEGCRLTDCISLGVVAKTFPIEAVRSVLEETGKQSIRERNLPAHVVVYYTIALAFYMGMASCREVLRCILEGVNFLAPEGKGVKITGRGGISQARERLGEEPMRLLHDRVVLPLVRRPDERGARGSFFRTWKVVSIDGSTMDVADTPENVEYFGRAVSNRGDSAFPKLRMVSLVENGTHVLFGTRMGSYRDCSEQVLAREVITSLTKDMLLLADRNFFSYDMWEKARATKAELAWRVKTGLVLPCVKRFDDGSYLSKIYPSHYCRQRDKGGVFVRVVEYTLPKLSNAEGFYRILTTILDPEKAPADELAALYHDRWEIESAFDELKTHLRGARIVLRSKRPDLVCQEFWGFLLAHFAVRGLMHEAAMKADVDPDVLSFLHTVRVVRRKLPLFIAFPPSGHKDVASEGPG